MNTTRIAALADLPRPVRLNNPGDLEHGNPWQGLSPDQPDDRFCKFTAPSWGFRAIAVTLCTYQDRYGVDNIGKAIRRWSATDQEAYIANVCAAAKRAPDEKVNFHDYNEAYPIIRAIAAQEAGSFEKYWKKADLDQGCIKAGLENAPRGAVAAAGHVVGTAVVGAGAYAASDPGVLLSTYNYLKPIVDVAPEFIKGAFWCVAGAAFAVLVVGWTRKVAGSK